MNLPKSKEAYIKAIMNPWKFNTMMGLKLPSLIFWGVKLKQLDSDKCIVSIPFRFTTQNPFGSIYFSALNGAAELSTGIPVQMMLAQFGPHSMLVTGFSATFVKKASTKTEFVCEQGAELLRFFEGLKSPGDNGVITLNSRGYNTSGDEVCNMQVTWSIKKK
jgi:Domain of unknown function (DUF4442)